MDPLVRKVFLSVPAPSLKDNRADVDRVLDVLNSKAGLGKVKVPYSLVRKTSEILHASGYRITLTIGMDRKERKLLDVEPGDRRRQNYGIAVDLGSTNIVYYLLDLENGTLLDQTSDENPQIDYGEDILSRIHACERPEGLGNLQERTVAAMNRNVLRLLQRHGISKRHLYAISVAGNTTMIHFLLGLNPLGICREPYIPVLNRPDLYSARDLGLGGSEHALLYVLPNVGSYVGGDVLAGVLVSGMHREGETSVLVDVGTNAEIVLGNREWLMVAAGAAGPALEGGVVKCGMRAAAGAIEKVRIDRVTRMPIYETIGGGAPAGICGSGLIDLMAELFLSGMIDERGRIVSDSLRVTESDGVRAFRVATREESRTGEEIVLTELDIGNLLKTKGAMYTALTVITRYAGISFQDLKHFYVAGTFGAYIDPKMAVSIGMLPDIPIERYRLLHNSSGVGACLTLLSNAKREELKEICSRVTYVELNVDGDFMNLLNAAMFLPHTDRTQFPSVVRHGERPAP